MAFHCKIAGSKTVFSRLSPCLSPRLAGASFLVCLGGIAAFQMPAFAQQPTKGAFTMPFSHDPNAPALPPPGETHLPYPGQAPTDSPDNRYQTQPPPPAKPDKVQQQARAIIASDTQGQSSGAKDEEDQVWNDPDSNSTPPGDNPDNPLFTFP